MSSPDAFTFGLFFFQPTMRFSDARGTPPPSDRTLFPPTGLQHQWLASRPSGHHLSSAGRPPAFSFGDDLEPSRRPGDLQKAHFGNPSRGHLGPSMVLDSRLSDNNNPMHMFTDTYRNGNVDMQYLRHSQSGPAHLDSKVGISKPGKKPLKENDAIEYLNLVSLVLKFLLSMFGT